MFKLIIGLGMHVLCMGTLAYRINKRKKAKNAYTQKVTKRWYEEMGLRIVK